MSFVATSWVGLQHCIEISLLANQWVMLLSCPGEAEEQEETVRSGKGD